MNAGQSRMSSGERRPAARKYGHRRRSVRFLGMLAAVCVLMLLIRGQIFVIREIEVTGNLNINSAEIAGQSGLYLGMSIFNAEKGAIERNLSANCYVELLDVSIRMPDTVILEIRERTPCAAVNCAGVIMLVDSEWVILERMAEMPQIDGVIVVSGMDVAVGAQGRTIESGAAGQLEAASKVLEAVGKAGLEKQISELNVANQDNMYLVSQSGVQVMLGDEEMLKEKLIWMRAVLETLTADGRMSGVLDVSSGKNAVYAEK